MQPEDMSAPGPSGPLRGTLLGPADALSPVALIVPGSGPTDRDGNSPAGVAASTYRLLAEGLARHGVTTVRADKRGLFGSAAAAPDPNAVTVEDYVADVRAWIAAIRARTGVASVWIIGHSEGGVIALAAAAEPDLHGLVLLATPGRPLGVVLREQLAAAAGSGAWLDQAFAAIARLEGGERFDPAGAGPVMEQLFPRQVQGFLISLFARDPAQMLAGLAKPVLIVQGGRDLQVGEADARRLRAANSAARLIVLPDANHVFKDVAGADRRSNLQAYADPHLPLAAGLTEAVAAFLLERRAPAPVTPP